VRRPWVGYCGDDVLATGRLTARMLPEILRKPCGLGRALFRGDYTKAAARMEDRGIPVDSPMLERLRASWDGIKLDLIAGIDADYGVYEGATFKLARFEAWLAGRGMSWPRLDSGQLDLADDTFRQMAKAYPAVSALRELRHALGQLRLNELAVGSDGRNRTMLSILRSKTGRNQPSNSKFLFGASVWLRGLVMPGPGRAVAYLDWKSQEVVIAAALSGDEAMLADALSDPYLGFAKRSGLVPTDATKATHGSQRDAVKPAVLGIQYGMSAKSMACRLGKPEWEARRLLDLHREVYPKFWAWRDRAVNTGMLTGEIENIFGWSLKVVPDRFGKINPRTLQNLPVQSAGASILQLACIRLIEAEIGFCAPIHDAVLIEGTTEEIVACNKVGEPILDAKGNYGPGPVTEAAQE
jgi:DNA polymerase I-like protein with 3'-5' exonuclease and polymerase domains